MNADVIRRAVNVKPEELDMDNWIRETECGTVACIAGNCALQHGFSYDVPKRARQLMGLTHTQANRLFHSHCWPLGFANPIGDVIDSLGYILTPGTREYLERVKQRVEHFITTGGNE